jgi:AraC-like DNA-binding protein
MMRYTEQRPSSALAKHLECFWFVTDTDASAATRSSERVLPDGCVEWIFHIGAPFQRWTTEGKWEKQPRSFVVGELTRFLLLQAAGPVSTMGVRFRPGGAYRFLPFPLNILTDDTIATDEIWGREGTHLEETVLKARSDARRQHLVEQFLLRRLALSSQRPRFEAVIGEIIRSRGQTRVDQLAGSIGLSPRQLEREFLMRAGLSPKTLARIIRFQNLLRLVGVVPRKSPA